MPYLRPMTREASWATRPKIAETDLRRADCAQTLGLAMYRKLRKPGKTAPPRSEPCESNPCGRIKSEEQGAVPGGTGQSKLDHDDFHLFFNMSGSTDPLA